ncbi:hypothetical protein, partial [Klebsiella pneumoniae]|uniref:hypothetical protein n=1 Tax=Klebsiella pneumoniae TaxID=573 RepID=UPI001A92480D
PLRLPGVIFFCISDTLVPTTYLVDTTLSDASDYDQTVHAVRLRVNVVQLFTSSRISVILGRGSML